jgi:hypothetical protein
MTLNNGIPQLKTMPTTDILTKILYVIKKICSITFLFFTLTPNSAHAQNQQLIMYSGNVKGEIEGCG